MNKMITSPNFPITKSLQSDLTKLWYFKYLKFEISEVCAPWIAKIYGLEKKALWSSPLSEDTI